jgi:hypothetical protein
MAVTTVFDRVQRAQTILQDTTGTRWPVLELQNWLNDSYKEIVMYRPDANSQTGTFTCASGTRQVLTTQFAGALRLLDVIRNVAATSAKRGVRIIDRKVLDDQRPAWHAETAVVNIQHFMFDQRLPKEFLVYPPATTEAQLEVAYSSVPSPHTLTEAQLSSTPSAEVIRIDDIYANTMLDYMLYRAYSKDVDYASNGQRAIAHLQAFSNAISGKSAADSQSAPLPLSQVTQRAT